MSIFVFSVLLGLFLHQIISIIQPVPNTKNYTFGRRIVVQLSESAYLTLKVFSIVVAIFVFVLVVTFIVAQNFHPAQGYAYRFADTLTSPRVGAAIFGALVGVLLGNLLNRILRNDKNYSFKSSDYLEIALIFLLVVLGIGGEELIRSYAQRINKISVGTTTEISFSDSAPKASRTSAEQPGGAFRNTQGDSGQSTGLAKLYDIGSNDNKSNIERDEDFIEVLSRYQSEPIPAQGAIDPLAQHVLSPIGSCLSGIFQLNGDSTFIEQQLVLLNDPLRELATSDSSDSIDKIEKQLLEPVNHLVDYVKPRSKELKKIEAPDKRNSCADFQDGTKIRNAVDPDSIAAFNKARESRPYATMAYAAAMAALHHYEPAVIAMDNWINATRDRMKGYAAKPPQNTVADRWYLLRARLTQGQFFDEWIRQHGLSTSSWLRLYHIDNLKTIADEMEHFFAISELSKRNNDFKLTTGPLGASESGDDGLCNIPEFPKPVLDKPVPDKAKNSTATAKTTPLDFAPHEEADELTKAEVTERLETIYTTYLSAKSDYVDQALKHPILKRRYASIIKSEATSLMSLSLRCITNDPQIARAERIERYVRNEINLIDQTLSLKSKESISERIRDNRQMLAFAFQLIEPAVSTATDRKNHGPILERIATNRVLEVYETLLATQDQLESYSERDVLN